MKFKCERDTLASALDTVARAVKAKGSGMAVLSGISFTLRGNELKLLASDLDLSIHAGLVVDGQQDGDVIIPARLISDIVRSMPEGAVTVETSGESTMITAGKSEFSVLNITEEYPRIAAPSVFGATIESAEFAGALRQITRAASGDESRPVLTGVSISATEKGLRLVATDSYRLAIRDLSNANVLKHGQSVLVPALALAELGRLLSSTKSINIAFDDREISFEVDNVILTSRLIEGQFPDYQPLLPKESPNRLRIDRNELIESVKRVKLLVSDATTPVRFELRSDGAGLTVVSQQRGQANDDVEAKYEGDEITIAFNPSYLVDGLESLPQGEIVMDIIDSLKPALLGSVESPEYTYLIMPVRVS